MMHIKKNYLYVGITILILLVAAVAWFFFFKEESKQDYLDENGLLLMPNRQTVDYQTLPYHEDDPKFSISKIIYESAGLDVHGLLLEPKENRTFPGVVLLPGAGVSKESELPVAKEIARLGYAVFVIDQRGVGETDGIVLPLEDDFINYQQGKVAVQHLFVVDALVAADVLSTRENVDPNNIILMGESFGGRVALIATAIDPRMKGAVIISSAGFHYVPQNDPAKDRFLTSLDADSYMSKISPRPLVMIHSPYDKTVPFSSARITFEKAVEPKLFIVVNETGCNHGYCQAMLWPLNYSLERVTRKI